MLGDAPYNNEEVERLDRLIDDMNPQLFGVVMDRLFAAGALDVYFTPVQMKKNRPGTLLTIVAPPEARALPEVFAPRYGSVVPGERGGIVVKGTTPRVPLEAE